MATVHSSAPMAAEFFTPVDARAAHTPDELRAAIAQLAKLV
jgi:hypothetical protein